MPSLPSFLRILAMSCAMTGISALAAGAVSAAEPAQQDYFQSHPTQFPDGISAYTGINYASPVGYRPLRLDLYRDAAAKSAKPLIVFVHGGAWETGNRQASGKFDDFPSILAGIAARGFVVASVEYRLNGEAVFPVPYHDIESAIRFLKGNAATYGIDPGHVGIWGSSSGGQLAALAAVACNSEALEKVSDEKETISTCVNTAAIWNGVFDFKAMEPAPKPSLTGNPRSRLLSCTPGSCTNAALDTASPITYVSPKSPPFFLAHSRTDDVVPFAQSTEFEKKLRANGVTVTTYYVDGLKHGFTSPDAAITKKAGDELLERTIRYFETTLK